MFLKVLRNLTFILRKFCLLIERKLSLPRSLAGEVYGQVFSFYKKQEINFQTIDTISSIFNSKTSSRCKKTHILRSGRTTYIFLHSSGAHRLFRSTRFTDFKHVILVNCRKFISAYRSLDRFSYVLLNF